jgi:hypothetical protein
LVGFLAPIFYAYFNFFQVYPVLYRTLSGYGINDNGKDAPLNGPIAVQVKALHEVFMSALRAKYYDAAIRHLCFILQVLEKVNF